MWGLSNLFLENLVKNALLEDLGQAGDITSFSVLDEDINLKAQVRARQEGVVCGLPLARLAFAIYDPTLVVTEKIKDGERIAPGQEILEISGNARSLFSAERVALNFLGHLSGISTLTARFVQQISPWGNAKIAATRKTTPGLRALEKAAVCLGGGVSHRYGLDDGVLIKDNHIAANKSLTHAVEKARKKVGHLIKIEVEVDTLEQVKEAVQTSADAILFDNMSPQEVSKALLLLKQKPIITEASGGITLGNIIEYAKTGVDLISVGQITHSATCLDIGLDID